MNLMLIKIDFTSFAKISHFYIYKEHTTDYKQLVLCLLSSQKFS